MFQMSPFALVLAGRRQRASYHCTSSSSIDGFLPQKWRMKDVQVLIFQNVKACKSSLLPAGRLTYMFGNAI